MLLVMLECYSDPTELISFLNPTLSPFCPMKPAGPGRPGRPGSPLAPCRIHKHTDTHK